MWSVPYYLIVLSRTGGAQGTVSSYYYDTGAGTASSGSYRDYSFDWDTVVWGDGDSTDKVFEVSVRDDSTEEGLESVILGLFYADGGALFNANPTSELTIVDDDVHYGAMRFSAATYDARESEGVLNVTIERSGGSFGEVTVDYNTEDASATAGVDYEAVSGTLLFDFDETEKTISIPIVSDGVQEGDETFKLNLSNPTRGTTLGFPALSTVTIKGNDNEGEDTGGTGSGGTGSGGTGSGGTGSGGAGSGGTESGGTTGVAGDSGTQSSGGGPLAPLSLLALLGISYFRQRLGN
ncbi:MAG: Calx-beta domain-containing protein [Thiotrichales bacterium]